MSLIESTNYDGEPYSKKRLRSELTRCAQGSAAEIKETLVYSNQRFLQNKPLEDDITLVVLKMKPEAIVIQERHCVEGEKSSPVKSTVQKG